MLIAGIYELSWVANLGTGQKDGFFFDLDELQRITKPSTRVSVTSNVYVTVSNFEITFKGRGVVGVNTVDEKQYSRLIDAQEMCGVPDLQSRLHLEKIHAELIQTWKLRKSIR